MSAGEAHLWRVALASLLSACASLGTQAMAQPPRAEPGTLLLTDARVYTGEPSMPWAQAVAVRNGRIVFVGSEAEARALGTPAVDLDGAVVLPGMVDAHTHPGLVPILGTGDPEADSVGGVPHGSRAKALQWLRQYAAEHPDEPVVVLGVWNVADFLPEGPNRRDLDAIFGDRPVVIFDNSGHSQWVNTAMMRTLGLDSRTPDLSPGLSTLVRDEHGDPTGWIKEFTAVDGILTMLMPAEDVFRARIKRHLEFLSRRGVTTLLDAGNFGVSDTVYKVLADMDRAGELPVRYFGSYHVYSPKQLDVAIPELLRLRKTYAGERLRFETIKIHYDGVSEIGTAAMLEPFATDSKNRGAVLFDTERLSRFILELEQQSIDLHLHAVGDRGVRSALDAVELARKKLGRPLSVQVAISHLETVDPADMPRFRALGVHANFTPHWFDGDYFGNSGGIYLGAERMTRQMQAGSLLRAGANVTLSSDVISSGGSQRADPFIGIEMSVTRRDYANPASRGRPDRNDERLTVEQALRAYTLGGATQLGIEQETGSIAIGKRADLVIVGKNPFEVATTSLHALPVNAVLVDGTVTSGSLPAPRPGK